MEPDMDVSFDLYWRTRDLIFEPRELDLGAVNSMYAPAEDSPSGLYSSCYDDSGSPDGASSCLTAAAVSADADADQPSLATKTKNINMERDRRRRLNDKLYAFRGVVPDITKMDKASIIRDAIAYIEQLQEQERRMLAEIHTLESAFTATVKAENLLSTGESEEEAVGGGAASPERKKMRRAASASSIHDALCSPATHPVEIIEVSEMGEKVAVISLRCYKTRDAMENVCRALESLPLRVMNASVTTVAGSSTLHTVFVEKKCMVLQR